LVKKTNTHLAATRLAKEVRLVAQQVEGFPDVVMKDKTSGKAMCKIPNGQTLIKIADDGTDCLVRWQDAEGFVKLVNIRPLDEDLDKASSNGSLDERTIEAKNTTEPDEKPNVSKPSPLSPAVFYRGDHVESLPSNVVNPFYLTRKEADGAVLELTDAVNLVMAAMAANDFDGDAASQPCEEHGMAQGHQRRE